MPSARKMQQKLQEPKKYSLSEYQAELIRIILERGNVAEVKIEKSKPVIVEIRRRLVDTENQKLR